MSFSQRLYPSHQKPVLIWDVGGVILEWDTQKFAENYEGGLYKEQCLAIFNHENWKSFDRGDLSYADLISIYSKQFECSNEAVNQILQSAFHSLKPKWPVIRFIEQLKELPLEQYCLTNGSAEYFSYVTSAKYLSAHQFSLFHLFDEEDILLSAKHRLAKPELEIYQLAEELFSLKGKKIIFIDDNKNNVRGALEAGWWQSVHFEDLEGCLEALKKLGVGVASSDSGLELSSLKPSS